MRKSRIKRHSVYLTPSPSPERELPPSRPVSLLLDWEVGSTMTASRPTSGSLHSTANPYHVEPPTLSEILSNSSRPPWTLAAFMAYLSQNHCLETLEFTMDADRYRQAFHQTMIEQTASVRDGADYICSLWEKLMQAYIIPYAPREVNLPARVRDHLLAHPCTWSPPHPDELGEAVSIVYELMNDSVLLPFIESLSPAQSEVYLADDSAEVRQGRSKVRPQTESGPKRSDESSRSPKFLPQLVIGRGGTNSRTTSTFAEFGEREGLTDDSGSASSPAAEPMTPPTTPPTSESTLSQSPGSFQRALSAHTNGWKKVGAKLGFGRKSRNSRHRSHPTSSGPVDGDVTMSDASLSGVS
ncbi:regulator of G protein signaling superfamily [Sodiomyces alkalinus F11]|uniref:Regulator of G protein signaling superfamily n=1 Tax=Sodiomyces alkalinus (strain CBS 110278 / VKM F-3762 / F11) TaxID=1314773 RepID=A0A3N2PKW0_SODAK|nr:regulator of G protein signaling superfamily [Sodiomyces alkalinus F11]ROT34956.1 regulator of G protein signaling superfamily [Sodiomyces alkalinus F11]